MYRPLYGGALTARPLRAGEIFTIELKGCPQLHFGITIYRLVIVMYYNSHTDIPAHTHTDVHLHTQTRTVTVCVALSPGPRVRFTVATVGLVFIIHFITGACDIDV